MKWRANRKYGHEVAMEQIIYQPVYLGCITI